MVLILIGIFLEISPIISSQKDVKRWKRTIASSVSGETELTEKKYPFLLEIPAIGYKGLVREGADQKVLKRGPGVLRGYPGESSTWIAGHRVPATFWNLPRLKIGDTVIVFLPDGRRYVYSVKGMAIVSPDDNSEIERVAQESDLVLFTCYPLGIAKKRWLVICICKRKEIL
ncbi:MAG: sortase [Patescibacteria group bacterium]